MAAKFDPKRGEINLRAVLLNLTADERVFVWLARQIWMRITAANLSVYTDCY